MSKNWFIVHFQPLEKYPPVTNFIEFVAHQPGYTGNLHVITTDPGYGEKLQAFSGIRIHRIVSWKPRNRLGRLFFYVRFNAKALWLLCRYRPLLVFYFETLSAFAPYFYKKWISRSTHIFIHYHEYTSTAEYAKGMALNRWLHLKERKMYLATTWVSHTNADRMNFFVHDTGRQAPPNRYLLPNHPPGWWYEKATQKGLHTGTSVAFVYVGALSLQTMHTREMAQFVASHPGECYWHIYSTNHEKEALEFLRDLNAPNIVFKGKVAYNELPVVLPDYDIGVILYTGDTFNYAYNAPNKFFEYQACGLNTWFGKGMKGMLIYEQPDGQPWVRSVDFSRLTMPSLADARRTRLFQGNRFTAGEVYTPLWQRIQNALNAPV